MIEEPTLTNDAEYFADRTYIRHGWLEDFRKSPALYKAKWIDGTIRDEETPATRLGSMVHCLALEHDEYERRYVVAPKVDRRTKGGKAEWEEFQQLVNDRTVITKDEHITAGRILAALMENRNTCRILDELNHRERIIIFEDEATSLPCKVKLDGIWGKDVIVDIKTSSDPYPETFARKAFLYGYHRQAAFYRYGLAEAEGIPLDDVTHLLLVVGTSEPHDVFVYQLQPPELQLGVEQVRRTLDSLHLAIEDNDWTHPASDGLYKLSFPRWTFNVGDDE